MSKPAYNFYRTRVWSLGMLVTNWLTDSLTNSFLVDLIDVTLKFCHYFAADAWFVVLKFNLGRDSEARFG